MNIVLKPEYEEFIQAQMQSGKYGSVEEIIGEAIALLRERKRHIAQIAKGQVTDGELVFARLQEKIDRIEQSEV
jgi:antitoxin ParD1/3/4